MTIQSVWAPVVAALGASALTTAGLLIRDWVVRRHRHVTERLAAYESLLASSMVVAQTAIALRLTVQIRSGLREGFDVALRHRRLLEPLDLADRLTRDLQPLFTAWTAVWAKGSEEAIPLANDLVDRCVDLIRVATEQGRGGTRVIRFVRGERWSADQEDAFREAHRALGESRRKLAEVLRQEGGEKAASLFAR
jgi:hypothetical protein